MNIRPVINHVFGYSTTFYVYSSTRSLYIYHIFVQWSFCQRAGWTLRIWMYSDRVGMWRSSSLVMWKTSKNQNLRFLFAIYFLRLSYKEHPVNIHCPVTHEHSIKIRIRPQAFLAGIRRRQPDASIFHKGSDFPDLGGLGWRSSRS